MQRVLNRHLALVHAICVLLFGMSAIISALTGSWVPALFTSLAAVLSLVSLARARRMRP